MPLRIADAFLKTVTAAATDSPVMLVVDDIDAADNASIAIIHTVAGKLTNVRILIVLVGRITELRLSSAADALTSDETLLGLISCPLDVLSNEASGMLVKKFGLASARIVLPVERILRPPRPNPLPIKLLTDDWASNG